MLIKAGHEVAGTTRSTAKSEQIAALGAHPIVVDALNPHAMFTILRAEQPDVVIHQLTDLSSRDFAGNSRLRVEGTRNLVDAAKAVGVQRMIAQSIAWIYVEGQTPAAENEPLDLLAPPPRGRTVAAVQSLEEAVAEIPVGVVLRYGILYGQGTWYARDGLTSQQIYQSEIEANEAVTSFVHVADAAQSALLALDWPAGAVNIVDDMPAVGTEWVPIYASFIGAPPPPSRLGRAGWERGASNAKARQFGWRPQFPTWREGFRIVLT